MFLQCKIVVVHGLVRNIIDIPHQIVPVGHISRVRTQLKRIRLAEPTHAPKNGCLTDSVSSNQPVDLPIFKCKMPVGNNVFTAICFCQIFNTNHRLSPYIKFLIFSFLNELYL